MIYHPANDVTDELDLDDAEPFELHSAIMAAIHIGERLYLTRNGEIVATVTPGCQ